MPELPEVETVKRQLAKKVTGCTIAHTKIYLVKTIQKPDPESFVKCIQNSRINSVKRRGKYLLFYLSNHLCLAAHLKMTGHFSVCGQGSALHKHTRVVFSLDNGCDLRFVDTRTFGVMYLLCQKEMDQFKPLACLGPEPLSDAFTAQYLFETGHQRTLPIKAFLLNQSFACGLGNIYVDESLFRAGILPDRRTNTLSKDEWAALTLTIKEVLQEGIQHRGTSIQSYTSTDGRPGGYQDRLLVYGKDQRPCVRCGTPIQKQKTAGRGTHFCPTCQR